MYHTERKEKGPVKDVGSTSLLQKGPFDVPGRGGEGTTPSAGETRLETGLRLV